MTSQRQKRVEEANKHLQQQARVASQKAQQQVPAYKNVVTEMQQQQVKKQGAVTSSSSGDSRAIVVSASKTSQRADESNVDGSVVADNISPLLLIR